MNSCLFLQIPHFSVIHMYRAANSARGFSLSLSIYFRNTLKGGVCSAYTKGGCCRAEVLRTILVHIMKGLMKAEMSSVQHGRFPGCDQCTSFLSVIYLALFRFS